jgi:hypothetical protein
MPMPVRGPSSIGDPLPHSPFRHTHHKPRERRCPLIFFSFTCSLRSVGIVEKISGAKGPQQNDLEFKCAVRWIICGEVQHRATGVHIPAAPDEWPGMAFDGGQVYEVLDVLLREYAPKRWPDHKTAFESMELVEMPAQPEDIPPFLVEIENALFRDHQEPCLILDAQCLNIEPSPRSPFEVNHANCIIHISPPLAENPVMERYLFLKDSNHPSVQLIWPGNRGLLSKSGHHSGAGPAIIWIRPKQDTIKVIAPDAVSPLHHKFFNLNLTISLSVDALCQLQGGPASCAKTAESTGRREFKMRLVCFPFLFPFLLHAEYL